CADLLGMDYW
nr:immunoglobulin heavy chain junction region [Mus musculus]